MKVDQGWNLLESLTDARFSLLGPHCSTTEERPESAMAAPLSLQFAEAPTLWPPSPFMLTSSPSYAHSLSYTWLASLNIPTALLHFVFLPRTEWPARPFSYRFRTHETLKGDGERSKTKLKGVRGMGCSNSAQLLPTYLVSGRRGHKGGNGAGYLGFGNAKP